MSRRPVGLSAEDAALWRAITGDIQPLSHRRAPVASRPRAIAVPPPASPATAPPAPAPVIVKPAPMSPSVPAAPPSA